MNSSTVLSNTWVSISVNTLGSCWSLEHPATGIRITSILPRVCLTDPEGRRILLEQPPAAVNGFRDPETPFGDSYGLGYRIDASRCRMQVEFLLPGEQPFVVWRWSVENQGDRVIKLHNALGFACVNQNLKDMGSNIGSLAGLSKRSPLDQLEMTFPGEAGDLAVYTPGWQSWSYGGWSTPADRPPRSRLRPLTHPMIYDRGQDRPRSRGHFRSEMFGGLVNIRNGTGLAFGYLEQRQSFGTVELIVQGKGRGLSTWTMLDDVHLPPGESFSSDWACILVEQSGLSVVDAYAALAGELNQARIPVNAPVGWCSWYEYGQVISEEIIQENLSAASNLGGRLPVETIQVDDGFQSEIGDWLEVGAHFKSGMDRVAELIKGSGFTAGLWLAPFIALAHSKIVRDHPEWVLRNRFGLPANTGLVWKQFGRALDISHPAVIENLERVISTATSDWGYAYLKLDFLYAGAMPGRRFDQRRTRAQVFANALHVIRETAGDDVTLVGCGCPLGAGVGTFDGMRIGPDVAATWKPSFSFLTPMLSQEPSLPAAVNSIRNILQRAHFHRRWWINDPDCVLVRKDRSQLTLDEIRSLATAIGLSGGSVMLSDALEGIPPERLEIAGMLIPPLQGRMQLVSTSDFRNHPIVMLEQEGAIGRWWLVACFNLGEQTHEFTLELDQLLPIEGEAHVFDVWMKTYFTHSLEEPVQLELPAHQTALLSIRAKDERPIWVGDTVHVSQGQVVKRWHSDDSTILATLDPGRTCDLYGYLSIPGSITAAFYNGDPVSIVRHQNGSAVLELISMDQGEVEIHWSGETHDD